MWTSTFCPSTPLPPPVHDLQPSAIWVYFSNPLPLPCGRHICMLPYRFSFFSYLATTLFSLRTLIKEILTAFQVGYLEACSLIWVVKWCENRSGYENSSSKIRGLKTKEYKAYETFSRSSIVIHVLNHNFINFGGVMIFDEI